MQVENDRVAVVLRIVVQFLQQFTAVAAIRGKSAGRDLGTHVDQLPQDGALADDLRIGAHIGRAGCVGGELADVAAAIDLIDQAVRLEPLGHRDRIAWPATVVQFRDGTEDEAMVLAVKIGLGDDVRDLVEGPRRKQQAP